MWFTFLIAILASIGLCYNARVTIINSHIIRRQTIKIISLEYRIRELENSNDYR